jgi:hypothetical protein
MKGKIHYSINLTQVVFEKFDDEIVLINLKNGNYFSINKVARIIWELIEKGLDKASIFFKIAKMYNKAIEEIEDEMNEFIGELLKEALINPIELANEENDSNLSEETVQKQDKQYTKPFLEIYTDMQDLILLDPIHEVDDTGWPNIKDEIKNNKELN